MLFTISKKTVLRPVDWGSRLILKGSSARSLEVLVKAIETKGYAAELDAFGVRIEWDSYDTAADMGSLQPQVGSVGSVTGLNHLLSRVYASYGELACPGCSGKIPGSSSLIDRTKITELFLGRTISLSDLSGENIIDRFTLSDISDEKFQEALRVGREFSLPRGWIKTLDQSGDRRELLIAFRQCCLSCGYEPEAIGVDGCEAFIEGKEHKGHEALQNLRVFNITLKDARMLSISEVLALLRHFGDSEKFSLADQLFLDLELALLPVSSDITKLPSECFERLTLALSLLSEQKHRVYIFHDLLRALGVSRIATVMLRTEELSRAGNVVLLLDIERALPDTHPEVFMLDDVQEQYLNSGKPQFTPQDGSAAVILSDSSSYTNELDQAALRYANGRRLRKLCRSPLPKLGTIGGYLGISPVLADRYASLPEAVLQGVSRKDFVKLVGNKIDLVRFKGVTMREALNLSIKSFIEIFSNLPKFRTLCVRLQNSLLFDKSLRGELSSLSTAEWRILSLIKESLGSKEGDVLYMIEPCAGMGRAEVREGLGKLISALNANGVRVVLADTNPCLLDLDGVFSIEEESFLNAV